MNSFAMVVLLATVALIANGQVTFTCNFACSVGISGEECTALQQAAEDNSVGGVTVTTSCSANSQSFNIVEVIASTYGSSCSGVSTSDVNAVCSIYTLILTSCTATGTCTGVGSSSCFPGNATAQLKDGSTKTMNQLSVGDSVLVEAGVYSDVYFFGHQYADAVMSFVKIAASNGNTLMLTADHYLYVNGNLATAKTVKIGDSLIAADGQTVQVVDVSTETATGLYNPHTIQGDIVVDGIKTSSYTASIAPGLAHAALWPVRMLYSLGVDIFNSAFGEGSELLSALLPNGKDKY